MALDLLSETPPTHLYRHDLESLFYVLIWAAVHYDIGGTVPYSHTVNPILERWDGAYEDARSAKVVFIYEPTPVLRCIRPVWEPLRATWLKPLCALFAKARSNANILSRAKGGGQVSSKQEAWGRRKLPRYSDDEDEGPAPPPKPTPESLAVNVDFETLGCLTFENFMGALGGWMPRGVPKKYREHAERLLAEK
ncbi:hypothetical protein BDN71DRAFT_10748 [Pleurotus eryngii]|uniref:Fungal-type protein kinase domain-containing protein n=1 Tax=Pleurotus eryngii TaxID=5323 RepID=A0A9P6DEN4_PLEER|nr:hypothetical protein BDN71DRAFT_10748 [Pleurotus eryngii]